MEDGTFYNQVYSVENRLGTVQKLSAGPCPAANTLASENIAATWEFTYDGDGTRVLQTYAVGAVSTTTGYYMGGLYEETGGVARKYYGISGITVAMKEGSDLNFLLTDHLGSVAAVTDAAGALLDQQRYMPFGAVRENTGTITQTDFGYTGQRDLSLMGLMDYKARFYDAGLGRFSQPDSIVPNAADPQAWNRYSYAQNEPLTWSDPSGHYACENETGRAGPNCSGARPQIENLEKRERSREISEMFPGVTVSNPYAFSVAQLTTLYSALNSVFSAFGNNRAAFANAFGDMTFTFYPSKSLPLDAPADADLWVHGVVRVTPQASYKNLIHEMGHIFDGALYRRGSKGLLSQIFVSNFNAGTCRKSPCYAGRNLFGGDRWIPTGTTTKYAWNSSLEDFADSFAAVVMHKNDLISDERSLMIQSLIALNVEPYQR